MWLNSRSGTKVEVGQKTTEPRTNLQWQDGCRDSQYTKRNGSQIRIATLAVLWNVKRNHDSIVSSPLWQSPSLLNQTGVSHLSDLSTDLSTLSDKDKEQHKSMIKAKAYSAKHISKRSLIECIPENTKDNKTCAQTLTCLRTPTYMHKHTHTHTCTHTQTHTKTQTFHINLIEKITINYTRKSSQIPQACCCLCWFTCLTLVSTDGGFVILEMVTVWKKANLKRKSNPRWSHFEC